MFLCFCHPDRLRMSAASEREWKDPEDVWYCQAVSGSSRSSPCLRGENSDPHYLCKSTATPLTAVFSSSTSSGHSCQLWLQHTIKSHLSTGCRCARKLRLSYSNSIRTLCQRSGCTSRMASQSGNSVCTRVTAKPRSRATVPKRKTTPASLVGA